MRSFETIQHYNIYSRTNPKVRINWCHVSNWTNHKTTSQSVLSQSTQLYSHILLFLTQISNHKGKRVKTFHLKLHTKTLCEKNFIDKKNKNYFFKSTRKTD